MQVVRLTWNDHDEGFNPDDPNDFEEWATVTVGDRSGGSDYQIHFCTPISIRRIEDKRGCFLLDGGWPGYDELVDTLNSFILEKTQDPTQLPDVVLSQHWLWEYSDMKG